MDIKEMVSNNKQVHFQYFKSGELWYITDNGFEFPVPVSDVGDATFLKQDKAMMFMRWINQHLRLIAQARVGDQ